jgi:SAM-dependent methyltransferase
VNASHYADVYGWVYAHRTGYGSGHGSAAAERVAAHLIGKPGAVLVDCGCGRNQFATDVRRHAPGARYFGVDVVRVDPVPKGVTFVQGPMWDLSVVPRATVITSFDALEHLYPEDVDRTLAAWARHLLPGGVGVFTIADYPSSILGPGDVNLHPTVRSRAWWLDALGDHFGRHNAAFEDGRHYEVWK